MATINTYDLNYTDAFKLGIKNYANFNGRASRSEILALCRRYYYDSRCIRNFGYDL